MIKKRLAQSSALLLLLTFVLMFAPKGAPQSSGPTLKKIAEFDLPGPGGKRFDYLTVDPDDHYLLSAHLAAKQTYVIDVKTNKLVATVTDTPGAEGVEYVPGLRKFYSSNAYDNTIGVVDLKQMKVVKKLKTEAKPDGSAYAAPFHKLYVSDERGKTEAVVDVVKDEIVKTLHFDSETGMPQYDPVARKVYVNLQDQNIFAVIDPVTDEVVGRFPVGRCKGNHGMALDPQHHRAFLSCEGNELMTVFDLDKCHQTGLDLIRRKVRILLDEQGSSAAYHGCGHTCAAQPHIRRRDLVIFGIAARGRVGSSRGGVLAQINIGGSTQ